MTLLYMEKIMPGFDLKPAYFREEDSKQLASKQLLPFLSLGSTSANLHDPQRRQVAPSKSLFSLAALTENSLLDGPSLFKWTTRRIYDVHGLLLFYDHMLPLVGGNELRIRTAASDLLRTPVWSVRAGPAINFDGLIEKALSYIKDHPELQPVLFEPESAVRLVCYGYPRMGILCYSRTQANVRFVVDLWDLDLIPVDYSDRFRIRAESTRTVWSPYDFVLPGTAGSLRARWKRNFIALQRLLDVPDRVKDLPSVIAAAGGTIEASRTTTPELKRVGQQNGFYCAAATARMIFDFHQLPPQKQDDIATAMNTVVGYGAEPEDQRNAILSLTNSKFDGELDGTASFGEARKEIEDNLPFRTGGLSHARACGGFLVEGGGKEWLYIYDPFPTKFGDCYYEAWDVGFHDNYIYVRPVQFL